MGLAAAGGALCAACEATTGAAEVAAPADAGVGVLRAESSGRLKAEEAPPGPGGVSDGAGVPSSAGVTGGAPPPPEPDGLQEANGAPPGGDGSGGGGAEGAPAKGRIGPDPLPSPAEVACAWRPKAAAPDGR